jgi:hypothetical protein
LTHRPDDHGQLGWQLAWEFSEPLEDEPTSKPRVRRELRDNLAASFEAMRRRLSHTDAN